MMAAMENDAASYAKGASTAEEENSFAVAVSPFLAKLARLARRLAPPGSADDVLQEALIRAWRHRATFDPSRGPYSGWLCAIVAHEASRRRRSWRRFEIPIHEVASKSDMEDRVALASAVAKLSDRQRLAVDCFYYSRLTVDETAVVMDCSTGTVKSTLADARSRLRMLLEVRQ